MSETNDRPDRVGTPPGRDAGGPSVDVLFDVLSDPYRRSTLLFLREETAGAVTLADLEGHLLRAVDDATDRRSVRTSLVHCHLPKLVDAGLVAHDRSGDTVRYRGDPRLEPHLDVLRGRRDP